MGSRFRGNGADAIRFPRADGRARPERYAHDEFTGEKHRRIDMSFEDRVARSTARPNFSNWGEPPASETDRAGAVDPMTAVLMLAQAMTGDAPCSGVLPVFDGHYTINTLISVKYLSNYLAAEGAADVEARVSEMRERLFVADYGDQINKSSREIRRPDFFGYVDHWQALDVPLEHRLVQLRSRSARQDGVGVERTAQAVDVGLQPGQQRGEVAAAQLLGDLRVGGRRRFEQLGGGERA